MSDPFNKLISVMNMLLSPNGCPWDLKQTHKSLIPYLIEEAYEVIDAIENGSPESLKEELGDLILQVVFHAALANREGHFNIDDVNLGIADKLIRRHPHVFGDGNCQTEEEVSTQWEAIKSTEKQKGSEGLLDSIPNSMPALMQAFKLSKRAAKVGFDWDKPADIVCKITEEANELKSALENNNIENINEEAGDLLFSIVNLLRFYKIDPEQALRSSNHKFKKRFSFMETSIKNENREMTQLTANDWEALWSKAKQND